MKLLERVAITMISIVILSQCVFSAEKSEREEILTVVKRFFESMHVRDADMARETLRLDGQYYGVRDDDGNPFIKRKLHSDFIKELPDIESEYVERMWDPVVLVHGRIAVVWAPYDFHVDGSFSHCGVDAFTLIKSDSGWEIAGAAYTIEPEGCDQSPLGQLESENE